MDNPGLYPLDPSSEVGKFRLASGDTNSVPYDPVRPSEQNYTFLSDDEITQFLAMSDDSIPGAIGYWYLQLAGAAALESKSIADHDLRVDSTKRAADLRAQAEYWFNLGGISLSGEEAFDIVPTGTSERHHIEFYGWV